MKQGMENFNAYKIAEGLDEVNVGITTHFRGVVLCDIGPEHVMSFLLLEPRSSWQVEIRNSAAAWILMY